MKRYFLPKTLKKEHSVFSGQEPDGSKYHMESIDVYCKEFMNDKVESDLWHSFHAWVHTSTPFFKKRAIWQIIPTANENWYKMYVKVYD